MCGPASVYTCVPKNICGTHYIILYSPFLIRASFVQEQMDTHTVSYIVSCSFLSTVALFDRVNSGVAALLVPCDEVIDRYRRCD